jgi:predicted 2-oxoglutarate/Fe(II)-dependent dioxygenase YbiX
MATTAPRFLVGDPIPRLIVPDLAGAAIDFSHQDRAGRVIVLVLSHTLPEILPALAEAPALLAPIEATVAVVLSERTAGAELPAAVLGLLDPARELASALGLEPPAIAVIGADTRLKALFRDHDLRAACDLAVRLETSAPAKIITVQAPVALIPGLFEPALCQRLIDFWQSGRQESDIVSSARVHLDAGTSVKKRTDVVVEDEELVAILRQRLARRVITEIRKAFQVEIVRHEALRIGCYDARPGGYFRRHRDNTTPYTAHRRFALTANLNDEFVGGGLRFPEYGGSYRPAAGDAIVFSSSLLHEALPVTQGRRFGLFTFFTDSAGAEQERMLAERERAAGRLSDY